MTPDTLNFNGDVTTFLGFVGILSTLLIIVTAFRRFYSSPYNVRVTSKKTEEKKSTGFLGLFKGGKDKEKKSKQFIAPMQRLI